MFCIITNKIEVQDVKKTAGGCFFFVQRRSINIIELTAHLSLNKSRISVTQYQVVTSDNHHKL